MGHLNGGTGLVPSRIASLVNLQHARRKCEAMTNTAQIVKCNQLVLEHEYGTGVMVADDDKRALVELGAHLKGTPASGTRGTRTRMRCFALAASFFLQARAEWDSIVSALAVLSRESVSMHACNRPG